MATTTLQEYRRRLYEEVFVRRPDALFDLADALLTYPEARSLVELAEAPLFAHRWPSLYAALSARAENEVALRLLCVQHLPVPQVGRLLLGIDTCHIHRPESHTSPAYPGWSFSSLREDDGGI